MSDFIQTREELVNVLKKLLNVEYTEEEEPYILELLERSVPDYSKLIRLMYWDDRNLTAEEIVDEALHYEPIITPPPSKDH